MKAYQIIAVAIVALFALNAASCLNVRADDIIFMPGLHGKYDNGNIWAASNSSSLIVNESISISELDGDYQAWFDNYNASWADGYTHFYYHFEWWFEGQKIKEWWPIEGFVWPIMDVPYTHMESSYGVNAWDSEGRYSFDFDHGYGHYNLTVEIVGTSTATVYYLTNTTSVSFTYLNPSTRLAAWEVMVGGVIGVLFLILAFPAMVIFVKSGRFISGIGALIIMLLCGWTLFVTFVLNSELI